MRALTSFLLFACISALPAGAAPTDSPCSEKMLTGLYESILQSFCSVNYSWDLLSRKGSSDREIYYCAASYAGYSVQGEKSAPEKTIRGEKVSLKKDADKTRKAFERILFRYGDEEVRKLVDTLNRYQNSNFRIQTSRGMRGLNLQKFSRGATARAAAGTARASMSIALMSAGLGIPIAVYGHVTSSTSTACAELGNGYYAADPEDSCRPIEEVSPEVLEFLTLSKHQQDQLLSQSPKLCKFYETLTKKLKSSVAGKFSSKVTRGACKAGAREAKIAFEDGTEAKATMNGLHVEFEHEGDLYRVDYDRTGSQHLFLKSIETQAEITNAGAVGPWTRYRFPLKDRELGGVGFQDALAKIARTTLALEGSGIMDQGCDGAISAPVATPGGESGEVEAR